MSIIMKYIMIFRIKISNVGDSNEDIYLPKNLVNITVDTAMLFVNPIVALITQPVNAFRHYIGLN